MKNLNLVGRNREEMSKELNKMSLLDLRKNSNVEKRWTMTKELLINKILESAPISDIKNEVAETAPNTDIVAETAPITSEIAETAPISTNVQTLMAVVKSKKSPKVPKGQVENIVFFYDENNVARCFRTNKSCKEIHIELKGKKSLHVFSADAVYGEKEVKAQKNKIDIIRSILPSIEYVPLMEVEKE